MKIKRLSHATTPRAGVLSRWSLDLDNRLPTPSRTINQLRNVLPLTISQHRFRLTCLINRQLARIMPTTTIMQERLPKSTALSKTNLHVIVVHPLRHARRVSHAATTPPLTRTGRRIQQFGRLKLMHRVKERHHLRSRASRVREIHRTPKSMQRH